MTNEPQESFWLDFINGMETVLYEELKEGHLGFDPDARPACNKHAEAIWEDGFRCGVAQICKNLRAHWRKAYKLTANLQDHAGEHYIGEGCWCPKRPGE